jgi:NAD(P)H-hydrate epimerase
VDEAWWMMAELTRKEVREVDRLAIQELGIPGVVLMENAGREAARVVVEVLGECCGVRAEKSRVVILCGGGNNGGDGYVIARHLHNAGVEVTVCYAVELGRLEGDARVNAEVCRRMGVRMVPVMTLEGLDVAAWGWCEAHVMVDALLGTGFTGEVRPGVAAVIERCNATRGPKVVAVDIPSGLECDTGQPSHATVRADVTVTFVAEKVGFAAAEAQRWLGRVVVAEIGVPPELIRRVVGLRC